MSKGALIGEGRIAEIYAWGDNQVLKLFREWCVPDWVDCEAQIARTVHAAGAPAPAAERSSMWTGGGALSTSALTGHL